MKISLASFTDQGEVLAERIRGQLKSDGDEAECTRCGRDLRAADWTAVRFRKDDALIFVGAAGIAVRSIAPYILNKASDPAVVVVDEAGRFAIPILSGHLGGANALASRIASLTGGQAVITTATDVRGVFAFDDWARRMNCAVENTDRIRLVSAALLAGDPVTYHSDYAIAGKTPSGVRAFVCGAENMRSNEAAVGRLRDDEARNGRLRDGGMPDVRITVRDEKENGSLRIIPRVVCAGVGCRRGTPSALIEKAVDDAFRRAGISPRALCAVASIDLKADEAGLLELTQSRSVPFLTYSAKELAEVPGEFTASAFVSSVTGVDNVCERAAVRAANECDEGEADPGLNGEGVSFGGCICRKIAADGVTVALAMRRVRLSWDTQGGQKVRI